MRFPATLKQTRKYRRDHHLAYNADRVYIAGEGWSYGWEITPHDEVTQVIHLWQMGMPLPEIAETMAREPVEVIILLADLAEKHRVRTRPGGLGGSWPDDLPQEGRDMLVELYNMGVNG